MLRSFNGIGQLFGMKIGRDAPPADTMFLTEEDINTENFREIIKAAFLTAEVDSDGHLKVTTDSGIKTFVIVDQERKFVKFTVGFGLKEDRDEIDKLRFINQLNTQIICCCFFMPEPTTLLVEQFLMFEGGVTAFQIVNTFRNFARIAVQSIRSQDEDDLVC